MIRQSLLFFLVFCALQLGWQTICGGEISHSLIDRGIVAPTAFVAAALTPGLRVRAVGHSILGATGGVSVVNGCDGLEILFLLLAAFVAAPLPPRPRLVGILIGLPLVYALNTARILALFHARASDRELFDLLHGIVAPTVMILSIGAFYHAWLRRHLPQDARSPG